MGVSCLRLSTHGYETAAAHFEVLGHSQSLSCSFTSHGSSQGGLSFDFLRILKGGMADMRRLNVVVFDLYLICEGDLGSCDVIKVGGF